MKFIRFILKNETKSRQGVIAGKLIKEISGDLFKIWDYNGDKYPIDDVTLTTPLEFNQVIGIGANYVKKEAELDEVQIPQIPVFFFKPTSSIIGPDQPIVIPYDLEEVKFESELAVVIGKTARHIEESEVDNIIFGYTIGNDVTAPQYFHEAGHWTLGKSFDSFTPIGPVIETDLNPDEVIVEAYHNGEKKQYSPTKYMIVTMRKMIAYLSKVMTLSPGDIILTGSPAGADFLKDGDTITCEIKGIGKLTNKVVHETK